MVERLLQHSVFEEVPRCVTVSIQPSIRVPALVQGVLYKNIITVLHSMLSSYLENLPAQNTLPMDQYPAQFSKLYIRHVPPKSKCSPVAHHYVPLQ